MSIVPVLILVVFLAIGTSTNAATFFGLPTPPSPGYSLVTVLGNYKLDNINSPYYSDYSVYALGEGGSARYATLATPMSKALGSVDGSALVWLHSFDNKETAMILSPKLRGSQVLYFSVNETSAFAFNDKLRYLQYSSASANQSNCLINSKRVDYDTGNFSRYSLSSETVATGLSVLYKCPLEIGAMISSNLTVYAIEAGPNLTATSLTYSAVTPTGSDPFSILMFSNTPVTEKASLLRVTPNFAFFARYGGATTTLAVMRYATGFTKIVYNTSNLFQNAIQMFHPSEYPHYELICSRDTSLSLFCSGYLVSENFLRFQENILRKTLTNFTAGSYTLKTFSLVDILCLAIHDRNPVHFRCQTFSQGSQKEQAINGSLTAFPSLSFVSFDMGSSDLVCSFQSDGRDSAFVCDRISLDWIPYFVVDQGSSVLLENLPQLFTVGQHNIRANFSFGNLTSLVVRANFNVSTSAYYNPAIDYSKPCIIGSLFANFSNPFNLDGSVITVGTKYVFMAPTDFYAYGPGSSGIQFVEFYYDSAPTYLKQYRPPYFFNNDNGNYPDIVTRVVRHDFVGFVPFAAKVAVSKDQSTACFVAANGTRIFSKCFNATGDTISPFTLVDGPVYLGYTIDSLDLHVSNRQRCDPSIQTASIVSACPPLSSPSPSPLPSPISAPSPVVQSPSPIQSSCVAEKFDFPVQCLDGSWVSLDSVALSTAIIVDQPLFINGSLSINAPVVTAILSAASLSVQGNLTISSEVTLKVEQSGSMNSGPRINVSGCATLDGSLLLSGNFTPGETLDVMSYSCVDGNFTTVEIDGMPRCIEPIPYYSESTLNVVFTLVDECKISSDSTDVKALMHYDFIALFALLWPCVQY